MKVASDALINLLHTQDKFYMADLYKITLTNGNVIRWTSADIDLTVGTEVYESFAIKRDKIKSTIGIEVDELSVEIYCDGSETVLGFKLLPALINGTFSNAILELYRIFLPTWMSQVNTDYILLSFIGILDIDEVTGSNAKLKAKSMTNLLNISLPRNKYMPSCLNTLYDTTCALSKANFSETLTVLEGSTRSIIKFSSSKTAGYYNLGTMTFLNGANTNVSRGIREHTVGQLKLSYPLDATPIAGNNFEVYAGCDKCQSTCINKFHNISNIRAYPWIPNPETLY